MFRSALLLPLLLAATVPAAEALPAGAKVASLAVRPDKVALTGPSRYSQLVVTAKLASGDSVDVTRQVKWDALKLATVSPAGQVRPVLDGTGTLTGTVAGQSVAVPVTVSGVGASPAVSFVQDVQPVLSKLGCNQGTCHGSAQGKNGFKLSLRGYDPIFDHRALTDDLSGRRFNRAAPDRSLMLLKPSGGVPHVGGVTMQPGDPYYEMLRQWIRGGCALDLDAPRVKSLALFPADLTIPLPGLKQQFAVIATYTDGTSRDVSAEAFLETSNTEVLGVEKTGVVTALRRGEATILARYDGAYAASTAVVMGDRAGFAWKQLPVYNPIDSLVDAKLRKVKIAPGELCDDATFLRRVSIDLTGLPPTADQVRAFLADARPTREKRDALVDTLLKSDAYVEQWTNRWADLLQVNRKFLGDQGAVALRAWIRNAVATDMPYDQFAHAVLTATGSNVDNPPASYYKVLRTPDAVMENTTQLFLAIRFNCNKCHDHPFERWTQDQYFELSSYFAQVDRKADPKAKGAKLGGTDVTAAVPLIETIADAPKGEFVHERTGKDAVPKFPFGFPEQPKAEGARRQQIAAWITSPKNPYFAKSHANRVWSYLTGVGVIEPVDDIRAGNPASNPELLDWLTNELVASKFDTQKLIRTICQSRTYQLSIAANDFNRDDELNYSHALPRRLPAEVLFDSIHRATGSPSRLPGLPMGARAAQLVDSNVDLPGGFLELFGKPVRESACECERSNTMMLGPVLAMVNGPIVAGAVQDPNGHLATFTAKTPDDARVVEEIYLSVLNRKPTATESKAGVGAITSAAADFERLNQDHARRQAALAAYQETIPAKQAAWEAGQRAMKPTAWTTLAVSDAKAKSGATLATQPDGSILVSGKTADLELYTLQAATPLAGVTALRLEVLSDPGLPGKGPGRAENGNFVLNEFKVTAKGRQTFFGKPAAVKLTGAEADFSQGGYAVGGAIDNNPTTGWAVAGETGKGHAALFRVAGKLPEVNGTAFTFTLDQRFGSAHTIGRLRLSATADANPRLTASITPELLAMLETPAAKRTPEAAAKLRSLYAAQDAEFKRLGESAARPGPQSARVLGAQDLAWALMNSPAFLFNH